MLTKDKIISWLQKKATESEPALVVAWFDIIKVICFVAFCMAAFGPIMDIQYQHIHNDTSGLYAQEDIDAIDNLHSIYKYVPVIALAAVFFYAITYSNLKRGQ